MMKKLISRLKMERDLEKEIGEMKKEMERMKKDFREFKEKMELNELFLRSQLVRITGEMANMKGETYDSESASSQEEQVESEENEAVGDRPSSAVNKEEEEEGARGEERKKKEEYEERSPKEKDEGVQEEGMRGALLIGKGRNWDGQMFKEYMEDMLGRKIGYEYKKAGEKIWYKLFKEEDRKDIWENRRRIRREGVFSIDEYLDWKEREVRHFLWIYGKEKRESGAYVEIENRRLWIREKDCRRGEWYVWSQSAGKIVKERGEWEVAEEEQDNKGEEREEQNKEEEEEKVEIRNEKVDTEE